MDGDEADVQRSSANSSPPTAACVSFAEKEPTLEDVFMMVTKGLVT